MKTVFHKQFTNLPKTQKELLEKAIILFRNEPSHPDLYNHPLAGEWKGHRSISFGGAWRAHFKLVDKETALFVAAGTRSQLYK